MPLLITNIFDTSNVRSDTKYSSNHLPYGNGNNQSERNSQATTNQK